MNKIYIYYHIFLVNNWLEIVQEQVESLKKSKLLDNSKIKIGAVYNENDLSQNPILENFFKPYKNIEISFIKHNGGFGESETLALLKDDCDSFKEEIYVLYIHAKGVTQHQTEKEKPVKDWRNMMEYFLIERWENCIEKLKEKYDCCGINYQIHAGNIGGKVVGIYIFNGNFFWANSEYIKKLKRKTLFEHRYSGENWIGSIEHNAYSFYNSPIKINLYYESNTEYKNEE